jgi:hypothetical protein
MPTKTLPHTQKLLAGGEVRKIYPLRCSGDRIRGYVAEHYVDVYGGGVLGWRW